MPLRRVRRIIVVAEHPRDETNDPRDEPKRALPDASMLTVDDYLEMYRTVGNRVRYEILRGLVSAGEKRPTELIEEINDQIDVDDSTIYYHLNELVDVGLVAKHTRSDAGQDGFDTYYRATIFGEKAITGGIHDLIAAEHQFDWIYNSSA